jgi:prevent-host-death family protein
MTVQMNIAEAKAKLSALVEAAQRGEEVVLAKGGKPVARIVPLARNPAPRPHLLKQLGYVSAPYETFSTDPEIQEWLEKPLFPDEDR